MTDPVVHITNGVPDLGTGNITTLGQTLLDGANLTMGVTTGAAVTTDATGTLQQYLRGLIKLFTTATFKAASTAPVGADPALVIAPSPNAIQMGAGATTAITQRVAIANDTVNANGQTAMAASAPVTLSTDQKYQTGMSPRGFSAAFSTLTRPANVTAYSALDSISDNATAGSVTALVATVSDTNDDPLTVTEILINSTDTGLAGKRIRAYLFNSDPTASTGVGAGDNVAFSQKKAGYVGSFSGILETGFSDGTAGRLVPSFADGATAAHAPASGFVVTKPASGAKTLWIQFQAVDAFTPSANSTTIIATARGFQGRAA